MATPYIAVTGSTNTIRYIAGRLNVPRARHCDPGQEAVDTEVGEHVRAEYGAPGDR